MNVGQCSTAAGVDQEGRNSEEFCFSISVPFRKVKLHITQQINDNFSWELHTQESDKRKKWRLISEGSDGKLLHRQFCQMTFCEFRHPGTIFIQLNNFFPLWLVSRVDTITEIARRHEDRKTFFSAIKLPECALKSFQTIDSCNRNFSFVLRGLFEVKYSNQT